MPKKISELYSAASEAMLGRLGTSSSSKELRQLLPSTVFLFTNECKGVHFCRTPGAKSWVSPFLDVVG